MNNEPVRPITIAISAMGGQGGGVLAEWIIQVAEHADYIAQFTSVPGVAQRTGATVYYLEIFPRSAATKIGRDPVMALMPAPGDVDIVLAGELMEAGRAALRGFITPERTTVIASTHRDFALSEKMSMGDGRSDHERTLEIIRQSALELIDFDMAEIAEQSGCVISSVLLGALSGADILPFSEQAYLDVIRRSDIAVDSNINGFLAGQERSRAFSTQPATTTTPDSTQHHSAYRFSKRSQRLKQRVLDEFPQSTHSILLHGVNRLLDYQDWRYTRTYLDRVKTVLSIEQQQGGGAGDYELTNRTARHLALWMSYEDIIRVAELKIRPERFERVKNAANRKDGQILRITEFMHPRLEEVCDTLPTWLAMFIMRKESMKSLIGLFCRRGYRIRTTNLTGFLLLLLLAKLKRWRRHTYRFRVEDRNINNWLENIINIAPVNRELAIEIAAGQRIIKGYGETRERGIYHFNSIMALLDKIINRENAAQLLHNLHQAALADENGELLMKEMKALCQ